MVMPYQIRARQMESLLLSFYESSSPPLLVSKIYNVVDPINFFMCSAPAPSVNFIFLVLVPKREKTLIKG